MSDPRRLIVKATRSIDDPERANLACNVAAVALASGVEVHLFLASEGVRLALPGISALIEVPEAPEIGSLLDAVYAGGTVTVCAPCASRRGLVQADFRPETEMGGSAGFVELVTTPGASSLVY